MANCKNKESFLTMEYQWLDKDRLLKLDRNELVSSSFIHQVCTGAEDTEENKIDQMFPRSFQSNRESRQCK